MLLRDVFDNNHELKNNLVVAVLGGVQSVYAEPNQLKGGWWQNIPICNAIEQCNCVMTWRSYKKGQELPPPMNSLPIFNINFVQNNLLYRVMNPTQDWMLQDSLYYGEQLSPLRYYLKAKTDQPYGGNVGFVAFDSLYQIQYKRDGLLKVGLMVEYAPKTNDLRLDDLEEEEAKPLFMTQGYHFKDYNIYTWALLEQIDKKLEFCGIHSHTKNLNNQNKTLEIFPNPANQKLYFKSEVKIMQIEIYDIHGKTLSKFSPNSYDSIVEISNFESGIYWTKVLLEDGFVFNKKWIKE